MIFEQLFDPSTSTYTYLLGDEESRDAILIDPVLEQVERDLERLRAHGLTLAYCVDTHIHADHVTGAGTLRARTGCLTAVCASTGVACADHPLRTGDQLRFGRHQLEVRHTPGHTNGCATYVVRDSDRTLVFTGDTLFIGGCGRTDFQQGDPATLYRSVHEQIYTLPDDAIIYPGHDYNGQTHSTVAHEKTHNARLKLDISEAQFIAIMDELKLGMPKKIKVAVPANMGCGLPKVTPSGAVKEMDPAQVSDLAAYRIVDVREPHEWTGEHGCIESANRLPQGDVPQTAEAWARDLRLLIVCRSGRRSRNVGEILVEMGFTDVSNLTGGMIAWNEHHQGGPTS